MRIFGDCIGRGLCVDFAAAALWDGAHHGEYLAEIGAEAGVFDLAKSVNCL